MCVYKRIKQVSVLKGVKLTVNCLDRYELYRLSLELDGKKRIFMDRFFCFLLRTKSVLRLKNRSRTGKTDDFSSPGVRVPVTHFTHTRSFCDILSYEQAVVFENSVISME